MTTTAAQLVQMQRAWLLAFTAPGGLAQGLAHAPELDVETVFAPPPNGTLHERLRVYADGYRERLLECLRTEYPGLQALLGNDLFTFFARAYIAQHPPHTRTLYDLGAGFPAFLARTQRGRHSGDEQRRQLVFAVELARLERACTDIALAEGLETAAHDSPVWGAAPFGSPEVVLAVPATTRVFLMHHGLDAFAPFLAHREEHAEDAAQPLASDEPHAFIAIWRHRYRMVRREVEPWQFFVLRATARRPRPLIDCAASAARRTGENMAAIVAKLALWLPIAQDASLLTQQRAMQR
jgi:hypothetical protein